MKTRIKSFEYIENSKLKPNEKNWRLHGDEQRQVFDMVLEKYGLVNAVLAYERDGELILIDGHMRCEQLPKNAKVPTLILDLDESEADAIMATHDKITIMAEEVKFKFDELIMAADKELAEFFVEEAEDIDNEIDDAIDVDDIVDDLMEEYELTRQKTKDKQMLVSISNILYSFLSHVRKKCMSENEYNIEDDLFLDKSLSDTEIIAALWTIAGVRSIEKITKHRKPGQNKRKVVFIPVMLEPSDARSLFNEFISGGAKNLEKFITDKLT